MNVPGAAPVLLLYLLAYAGAAAGIALPLMNRRRPAIRSEIAAGRFLQIMAVTGILPSLQAILDGFGIIAGLPGLWGTLAYLGFSVLVLAGLWSVSFSWQAVVRAVSPAPWWSDRASTGLLIVSGILVVGNIGTQAAALLTGTYAAARVAQLALNGFLAFLLLVNLDAIGRLLRRSSGGADRDAMIILRWIPAAFVLFLALIIAMDNVLSEAAIPLLIITVLVLAGAAYRRLRTGDADAGRLRDELFDAAGMTPREREIALMLAEGLSYKEISAKLFISLSTIQTHVTRIYGKMGVNSKTELSRKVGG